ncbi:MAG: hypothetical protein AABN95_20480 [Acidobacteriota bacterium]
MKKIIATLAACASLVILAAPVFAQATAAAPAGAQGACTEEAKAATYTDFTTLRPTDPPKAYEAAKKYLGCSQGEDQYTAYLKKWVAAYEKAARTARFPVVLYNDKNYAEAMSLGKQILAEDPENMNVLIGLGYLGYLATVTAKNESFNTESLDFARRAIKAIESGKAPAKWDPFKSKDDTLAYLYNALGRLTVKNNSPETLTSLIKAAQFEGDVKKDPGIYYLIGASYESGPYAKMSADYKTCCEGKDETPESKLALANINQVVDRMIDAYARAVALAGNDPKFATPKKEWLDSLATWYKYRHNQSDAGLNEMIAAVLSKPLPPEPTPLTTLPAGAPTSTTPTSGATNAAGSGNGASTTASVPTQPATPVAAPSTTAATKTTTAKPKPRNNHRRRN